jgi:hypothetical protein
MATAAATTATAAPATGAGAGRPVFPSFGHMSKEPRLAGKVCMISGASRGFGQAIAVRFIEEGGYVAMLSRSSCDETLKLISSIEGITPEYVGELLVVQAIPVSSSVGTGCREGPSRAR